MRWRNKPLQRQENSQDTVLFLARAEGPKLNATRIFGSQNLLTHIIEFCQPFAILNGIRRGNFMLLARYLLPH